jgi:hypothetical protein
MWHAETKEWLDEPFNITVKPKEASLLPHYQDIANEK